MKVLHLPKYPPRRGGMDALLRLHIQNNESVYGLLQHNRLPSIGFRTLLPFCLQRGALKRLTRISSHHDVSIYYNCWGADLFSAYDRAPLRIGYIHNHFPAFEKYIQHFAPYLDGFLTVNPATTECIQKLLQKTHPQQNIQTIPLPITPPTKMPQVEKEDIIGLVGRINYEQKRYDRLPEFARLLEQVQPDMRIEVLGDGPQKQELIQLTKANRQVRFLPWTEENDYWKTLAKWKYVLFLSDYEGLPIALLEAIHTGCVPIYPDLHQGHQQELDLRLYPRGNMQKAVQHITDSFTKGHKRTQAKQILLRHNLKSYHDSIHNALKTIFVNKQVRQSRKMNRLGSKSYNKEYARIVGSN